MRLVPGNARSSGGEQWAITRNLDDETISLAVVPSDQIALVQVIEDGSAEPTNCNFQVEFQ